MSIEQLVYALATGNITPATYAAYEPLTAANGDNTDVHMMAEEFAVVQAERDGLAVEVEMLRGQLDELEGENDILMHEVEEMRAVLQAAETDAEEIQRVPEWREILEPLPESFPLPPLPALRDNEAADIDQAPIAMVVHDVADIDVCLAF